MIEDRDSHKPKGGLVLSVLLPVVANLIKSTPPVPEGSVVASTGSVAVAGDNLGSILNLNANSVTIVERQIARELPSYLSKVVARFSEDVSGYNSGPKRS